MLYRNPIFLLINFIYLQCTGSNSLREQHRSSQSMTSGRIECCRDIETLTSCFLSIYESLLPSAGKKDKQNQLLQSLAKPINKEWPSAKLHLYGSCANSFGLPDSDVDICLAIDDPSMSKHDMLLKLADILQSEKYQDVEVCLRAIFCRNAPSFTCINFSAIYAF